MDWFYHSGSGYLNLLFMIVFVMSCARNCPPSAPSVVESSKCFRVKGLWRQKCTQWCLYGRENILQLQLLLKSSYKLYFVLIRSTMKFSLWWWTVVKKAHKTCRVVSICSVSLDCVANVTKFLLKHSVTHTHWKHCCT